MSASATNYIVNNGNYPNKDLNTIFAPISRGAVDYGTFNNGTYLGNGTTQSYIGEAWCLFNDPSGNSLSAGNVSVIPKDGINGGGFQINTAGFYRLYITLFFTGVGVQENFQRVLFILNNSKQVPSTADPADLTLTFIPSPTMAQIYSINCSGSAVSTDNTINNVNNADLNYSSSANNANLLAVLTQTSNPASNPYYFAFLASSIRSNMFTLDITFNATAGQIITPQIVCQGFDTYNNPRNTLNGTASKWTFYKL